MQNTSKYLKKYLLFRYIALLSLCLIIPKQGECSNAQVSNWQNYFDRGVKAYQQAKYGEAESLFELSINEAEKFGENNLRLASSLDNLGLLLKSRGQFNQAAQVFDRSTKIKQASLGPDHPAVIESFGRLCQIYLAADENQQAEPIANRIIQYSDKVLRGNIKVKGNVQDQYNFDEERPDLENEEITSKRIKVQPQSDQDHDLELAALLDSLGTSYKGIKQNQFAERFYVQALELRQRTLSQRHMAVASSYEHLAQIYSAEGKCEDSLPLYKQALEISRSSFPLSSQETFSKLNGLGECYIKLGQLSEAKVLYDSAYRDFMDKNKTSDPRLSTCDTKLGTILARQGDYVEACRYYLQALNIAEQINGPLHVSLAPISDQYADMLDRTNRHSEATAIHARAAAITQM